MLMGNSPLLDNYMGRKLEDGDVLVPVQVHEVKREVASGAAHQTFVEPLHHFLLRLHLMVLEHGWVVTWGDSRMVVD